LCRTPLRNEWGEEERIGCGLSEIWYLRESERGYDSLRGVLHKMATLEPAPVLRGESEGGRLMMEMVGQWSKWKDKDSTL
jgi:hypothetical protein